MGAGKAEILWRNYLYYGHSTFSLTTPSGQIAIIDPWVMTNPQCPESLKKVNRLDAIFITHGHSDHTGDLLALARQHKPKIVATFETYLGWNRKEREHRACPETRAGRKR